MKFKQHWKKRLLNARRVLFILLFILSIVITPVIAHSQTPTTPTSDPVQSIDRANQHYQTSNYTTAARILQEVVSIFEDRQDRLNQAMALSNLSLTYQKLGNWDKAEETIERSLEILPKLTQTKEQQLIFAQSLDIQGHLQQETGQAQDAIATWQQSAQIYARLGEKTSQLSNFINQAQALQDLGLYPRACKTLLSVLEIDNPSCQISEGQLEKIRQSLLQDPSDEVKARGLRSFGNILRVMGNIKQSRQVLQVSLAIAQQWGDTEGESKAWLNLGNTERSLARRAEELEDIQKATLYTENALNDYRQAALIATPTLKLQAQLNQLDVLVEQANWTEAEKLSLDIHDLITELPLNQATLNARINLAKNSVCLQQKTLNCFSYSNNLSLDDPSYREIAQQLETAIQDSEKLSDRRNQSYILGLLGKLDLARKQWNLSERYTQQALSLAWQEQASELAYQWQWQLGKLYEHQGKWEAALTAYRQAVGTLQSIRSDLIAINSEVQFTFREGVEPVYRDYVRLLLRSQGTEPSQEHLKQAREAIDSLQLGELENFLRLICLDAFPVSIDTVTDTTDPTAAIIYPILLDDRFEIVLKLPQQSALHHYTVPIDDRKAVGRILERLTRTLRQRNSTETLKYAQTVYNWLIRPLETDLARATQIENLVFVLDSSLRNVPMSVLYDGRQYLIEKYGIAITPGLQLLDPQPLKRGALKVLTAGLSEARSEFPPLDFVPGELKQVRSQVSDSVELLDRTFTTAALQSSIGSGSFSVVHLATHGQFSSQADETFILTWDDRLTVDRLNELLRSQDSKRKGTIELLVLSACETLTGDNRAALGLAGVAVRAGARSTLATLWNVNDEAAALLMGQFYDALKNPQITKAEALRLAQLTLLKDPLFQSPYYWASYVLLGNWL